MENTTQNTQPEWGIKLSQYIPIPQRVIMSLMCFLAIINGYTLRICLSVAITKLVPPIVHNKTDTAICPPMEGYEDEAVVVDSAGTYNWSQELQGFILGSFYIGYIIGHVPAGILSVKYGAKWVLALGLLTAAIFNIITPPIIQMAGENSARMLILLRILIGLASGCTFPTMSSLLAQWVPAKERGFLGALIMGGGQIGTVLANSFSGLILHYASWPWVFYVFGIACVIWFLFFIVMCFSDPDSHPYVKPSEKEYLMQTMGRTGRRRDLPPTPWGDIFSSKAIWALISAQVAHDWGFYVIASDLPKYLNDVLRFPIKKNGFFSALPFFAMWIFSLLSGGVSDLLYRKGWMTLTNIRIFWTFIAAVPCGVFLVLSSYAGCRRMLVVALFTVAMALNGGFYAGIKLSPNDMSPNYSATVLAVVNAAGAVTGVLAPYSVGWMTPNATLMEWRVVFWVAFAVLTIFTIPFCFWGTAEVQYWDDPKPKEEPKS